MQSKPWKGSFGWVCVYLAAAPVVALPPNFYDEPIGDEWTQAVGTTFASDGRMFVWEKAGLVWNVENGVKAAAPLIDISEEVGDWRDYGLVGFALDPNFYSNGYIYLLYVVDYHHLIYFGTPQYNPNTSIEMHDTIGRITRYTCNAADGFRSVNYASRLVLLGESIDMGIPICHQSHGVGSLAFGLDGTLLASGGDGASYQAVDQGGCMGGSTCTCLDDGIITTKEDIGAFRSQLVDSLSGKILRLDPATGNGVPDNPFYDPAAPRAPRSRVWALGLRNPYRFNVRPGTGHGQVAHADPGTIYLGDVGWGTWEEMSIASGPAVNFGWPHYEGMDSLGSYANLNISNRDAPNPLWGTNQPGFGTCNQRWFYFRNLIKQDTLGNPFFANPCNTGIAIPANIPKFIHKRPAFDWLHGSATARSSTYQGNNSVVYDMNDPQSPVIGAGWAGNASTAGAWYVGSSFPAEFQNSYYHADFGGEWIRQFIFDANDNPVEVRDFLDDNNSAIVSISANALDGALYYIAYDRQGCCMVRRISYLNNVPPTAVANGSPLWGPAPLAVQFSSAGSFDPDPDFGEGLSFEWDFDDDSPINPNPNPNHVFDAVQDITGQGVITARVYNLNPPGPLGGGSYDPEVMRDGDFPPVGSDDDSRQFDTFHEGDQGNTDWVGYTFSSPKLISRVVFQEGKHFYDGGWFDTLAVQVRNAGVWSDVPGTAFNPPYAGDDGVNFETYEITFPPISGDGIRLHGNPGGDANFISIGELRVYTSSSSGPQQFDVTLTVTDSLGASSSAGLLVSLNNSPPQVTITSPPDGSSWPLDGSPVPLTADIFDAEHGPGQLTCRWQTILHHNDHEHPEPYDSNCTTTTSLTPVGHEGETFFYEVQLLVTDAHGLSTLETTFVYAPDCNPGGTVICDDGDFCNGLETCVDGVCVDGVPPVCNDGNFCNGTETCHPVNGCAAGTPPACNDGDACNGVETCSANACQPGTPMVCDDGNVCNGQETCEDDECVDGTPLTCNDGNFCNGTETCHPVNGCAAGTPPACNDGDTCNGVETCSANACQPGTPMICDDGNVCNGHETCANNACVSGTPPACSDGNACNGLETCFNNSCQPGTPMTCDDGDACNGVETCSANACQPGTSLNCDDGVFCNGVEWCASPAGDCISPGNPCTATQVCDESLNECRTCVHDGECADADPCTVNSCVDGDCQAATPVDCAHLSTACSTASCDPTGLPGNCEVITLLEDGASCSDGDACTTNESCQIGVCTGFRTYGLTEWKTLSECLLGPDMAGIAEECQCSDLNGDNRVDPHDVAEFQILFDLP